MHKMYNNLDWKSISEMEHFTVLHSSSCSPYCPDGWVTYSGRCFKYFNNTFDWISAEDHCLSLDANLVSIHNENEYQLVKALIRDKDPKDKYAVWIGLSACQKFSSPALRLETGAVLALAANRAKH
uniref:C-type lectin domain-containing protein n=1 Tax=Astyanax mexicanus TaxID=7994 RepID=A0A8B9GSN0_ASTMX